MIRGDRLSCYTAAIGELMARAGVDQEVAIGAQVFLAVRVAGGRPVGFVHHHTPLRGALPLVRRGTVDPAEAWERIAAECERSGAAIVAGDGRLLPWHLASGVRDAPHWFVVEAVEDGQVRVADPFDALTPWGHQGPFSGRVDLAELTALRDLDLTGSARERHAFGDRDTGPPAAFRGVQWFESAGAPTPVDADRLLAGTRAFHGGGRARPDLDGWLAGLDAVRFVLRFVAGHQDEPAAHDVQDDLWVAARHRLLFCDVLDRLAAERARPDLAVLAGWARERLAGRWAALLRVLEYGRESMRRGRAPRSLPAGLLSEVAAAEEDLVARLGGVMEGTAAAPPRPRAPAPATAAPPVAPRTPVERAIAGIWADVLGERPIGVHDRFLDLGGDSLRAVRMVSRLRDTYGVELSVLELDEVPTVAELAALLASGHASRDTPPPLAPVSRDRPLAPAPAQARLWFLDRLDPGNPVYNVPLGQRVRGPLDAALLRRALAHVVARQEALRTAFAAPDGDPLLAIAGEVAVEVATAEARSEAEARRLATIESRRAFDLGTAPLLRALLVGMGREEHVLVLTAHHAVCDGWSLGVLVRELWTAYDALRRDADPRLPPLPVQAADFAQWQRAWPPVDALAEQLQSWRRALDGAPAVLDLPADRPWPAVQGQEGASVGIRLGADLSRDLRRFAREEGATPFAILLAGLAALLGRYTGQTDLCVGTVVANRPHRAVEDLVGCFANTLVLRADLTGRPSLRELVRRSRSTLRQARLDQDVPFERLVAELRPERSLGHSPLFQVMLVLQDPSAGEVTVPGLELSPFDFPTGSARFELVFAVTDGDDLAIQLDYRTDLFEAATADRMLGHLAGLLASSVREPDRPLAQLPLPAAAERRLLGAWNATDRDRPAVLVHELIAMQAARTPNATAVEAGSGRLAYAELDARANRLAHHLRAHGVGPETRVGVCVDRSLELLVALLGVLKAGGAYVPLDPAYPAERLSQVLRDAQAPVVLTCRPADAVLPAGEWRTVRLDADWPVIARLPAGPADVAQSPDSLCYVIHTSGSTGRPKGVMISHRALVNHLLWRQEAFPLTPADRALQKTSFSFDAAAWELFWPLTVGACIVMADPGGQLDVAYQARVIEERGITVVDFVPSLLKLFLEEPAIERLTGLRHVFSGSEAVSVDLQQRFYRRLGAALHNGYGPTEATLGQAYWTCRPGWPGHTVPIGRPTANHRVHVLDAELRPVPIGVTGELCIAGVGLARGYLGAPGETAARFLPDPEAPAPGGRLYRTGDLARWRGDGCLEFLGRLDDQVKVRGFRVEPGEVETALRRHTGVRDAAVVMVEDAAGDRSLAGYVVAADGAALDPGALRALLAGLLPAHMVPTHLAVLDSLPLAPNGKLDRLGLAAMHAGRPAVAAGPGPAGDQPRGPLEEALCRIWAEVLGRDAVGAAEDFFEAGGHSLVAARLVARVRHDLGVELPIRWVFEERTVTRLAARLGSAVPARRPRPELRPRPRVDD